MRAPVVLCAALLAAALVSACGEDPVTPPSHKGRVLTVDDDNDHAYPSIRAALAVAADGDTISLVNDRHVGDGNRDLDIGDRSIVIRSQRGNAQYCLVDADGYYLQAPVHHYTLHFAGTRYFGHLSPTPPRVLIENLTIEDGFESVVCDSGSAPVFRGCTFDRNFRAVTCRGASSPTFIDCSFDDNDGSALYCEPGSRVTVTGGRVWQNFNWDDGGGIALRSASLEISDCQFIRNGTTSQGAAIFSGREYGGGRSTLHARNCRFHFNGDNEAVWMQRTDFVFDGCIFSDNDGPMFVYEQSRGRIVGSLFYGEGVYLNSGSQATIESSILCFVGGGPGLDCGWDGTARVSLACTDLYGNTGDCAQDQIGSNGNTSVDPRFCYFKEGDYRLYPDSPIVQNVECLPAGGWNVGCGPVAANSR